MTGSPLILSRIGGVPNRNNEEKDGHAVSEHGFESHRQVHQPRPGAWTFGKRSRRLCQRARAGQNQTAPDANRCAHSGKLRSAQSAAFILSVVKPSLRRARVGFSGSGRNFDNRRSIPILVVIWKDIIRKSES